MAAAGALGLNLVGVAALVSSLRAPRVVEVPGAAPPPEVIAVPTTVPFVIPQAPPPSPTVLPARRGPRAACPPPRHDAARVTPPELDDAGVDHLVVAPSNAGWVAAWSESSLYISFDAGAHFTRVNGADLDDDRSALHDISDVTFDCYGRAIVIANSRLGIYERGTLSWLYDFGDDLAGVDRTLIGGGPDIVIVHDTDANVEIAASSDLAATWTTNSLWPARGERHRVDAQGQQTADGTILVRLRAELRGDTTAYEGRDVKVRGDNWIAAPLPTAPGTVESYGTLELAQDGARVLWSDKSKPWQPVEGLPTMAEGEPVLVPGTVPSVVVGDALYTIARGKARRALAWPAPEGRRETTPAMIDVAGRVWGIEMHGGGDCDGSFAPVLVGRVR